MPTRLERHRDEIIPRRMMAIDTFNLALNLRASWNNEPKPMEIFFDGKLKVEGLSTGWTNPVIEVGVVHCRVLLEFLGLKVDPNNPNKLTQRSGSRQDDVVIENYAVDGHRLRPISVEEALSKYPGSSDEAERALANLIFTANKGVAHSTTEAFEDPDPLRLHEIGSRGVPSLINSYFYKPLNIAAPNYKIKSRQWS